LQGTSALSPSDGSEAEDASDTGIDKRHWKAQQARSKFQPSRVKADGVDFSDRLNVDHKSYRTYTNRRRPGHYDDAEEYGDFSDEEEETLDRKLARLRQEVEQIKASLEEDRDADSDGGRTPVASGDALGNVEKLSEALDSIYTSRRGGTKGAEADLSQALKVFSDSEKEPTTHQPGATTIQPPQSQSSNHMQALQILARAAEFDSRLILLETSLGVTAANMPDIGDDAAKPILPMIQNLEQVIGTAFAQPSQLEAAQAKTRQLLKDAERLSRVQAESRDARSDPTPPINGHNEVSIDSVDQQSKVNALYGLLPSIDSLSPTVPLLLDRLRTLRLLHTSAATSSATLSDIEQQQQEQEEEIKQWKEALDQVEKNLKEGQSTLSENMQKMGDMVKNLEGRISSV
jgi:nuclear migration protein JNM1